MKKILAAGSFLIFTLSLSAQDFQLEPLYKAKMSGWGKSMNVFHLDSSGMYILKSGQSGTYDLIKTAINGKLLFEKDYLKVLGEMDFVGLQYFSGSLILLGKKYDKVDNSVSFFGTHINSSSGDVIGSFELISKVPLFSPKGVYYSSTVQFKELGQSLIQINRSPGSSTLEYSYIYINKELSHSKLVNISLPYKSDDVELNSIFMTKNQHLILYGSYFVDRKKYRVRYFVAQQFDVNGKLMFKLQTTVDNKHVVFGRIVESESGELFIGGKYKIDSTGEIEGMCLIKCDTQNGRIINAGFRPLIRKSLGFWESTKKHQDDKIGSDYTLKDFFYYQPEKSFYFILEASSSQYMPSAYKPSGSGMESSSYIYYNNNMLLIKMKEGSSVEEWITGLHKAQTEAVTAFGPDGGSMVSYANNRLAYPYFSSYVSSVMDGNLILLVNDHKDNIGVTKPDDDCEKVSNFDKSILYAIIFNLKTGTYTRKKIYDNNENSEVFMPRYSVINGREFYIPAQNIRIFKLSEFKIAKVAIQ